MPVVITNNFHSKPISTTPQQPRVFGPTGPTGINGPTGMSGPTGEIGPTGTSGVSPACYGQMTFNNNINDGDIVMTGQTAVFFTSIDHSVNLTATLNNGGLGSFTVGPGIYQVSVQIVFDNNPDGTRGIILNGIETDIPACPNNITRLTSSHTLFFQNITNDISLYAYQIGGTPNVHVTDVTMSVVRITTLPLD